MLEMTRRECSQAAVAALAGPAVASARPDGARRGGVQFAEILNPGEWML